jgi:hypothetical protein
MLKFNRDDAIKHVLNKVQSARDLRAEILAMAFALTDNAKQACLELHDPRIGKAAIDKEWTQALGVLAPEIAGRMHLEHFAKTDRDSVTPSRFEISDHFVPIERPNYRFEVLRWLITASVHQDVQSVKSLGRLMHISRTPIEAALNALEEARLVSRVGRGQYSVRPEDISKDVLAKLQAFPQMIRFRFGLGSTPKSPGQLFSQVNRLTLTSRSDSWLHDVYLSGVAGAYAAHHHMDLMGVPRVDLVMHVASRKQAIDTTFMRDLDDGLEPDRSPLGHAPVVLTLVHSGQVTEGVSEARVASPGDIFLSMIDLGLKGPAMEYIKGHTP